MSVSSCDKCCSSVRVCSLQIFNLLDLIIGGFLVGFGLYLRQEVGAGFFEDASTSWLAWCSVIMGGLLLLISITSICSITNTGCRWLSIPSGYLALIVAFFALSLGIAALAKKDTVFNFLTDSGSSVGLSNKQIKIVETWYQITAYVMFGLCIVEIIRYRESMKYRELALKIDNEYETRLIEDDKKWNEQMYVNKVTREEKYSDLKAHYKAKYGIGQKPPINSRDNGY